MKPDNKAVWETSFLAFGRQLHDKFSHLPLLSLNAFDADKAVLVIVDMVNGFAKEGAMSSPRVGEMIAPIAALAKQCEQHGIEVIAPCDIHTPDSTELTAYPPHCLEDTAQSELCREIARAAFVTRLDKNSTNAAVSPAFRDWLTRHPSTDTFLVVGDCTDICVVQFVLTLKALCNEQNKPVRIVVDTELTDTFDAPQHPALPLNAVSYYLMDAAGIQLARGITADEKELL